MSEIRVNSIVSETGTGNVAFNKGVNVTGVVTATSFKGDIVGDVTGNVTGNCSGTSGSATGTAGGLTGTPDITVQNITGVAATFTGAVTYEDVTNVDSIGIVTARGGLEVGAAGVGGTVSALGHVEFVGVTTIGLGLTLADNIQARFGNAGDLKVYHDTTNSYIQNATNNLFLQGDAVNIRTLANQQVIETASGGSVELFEAGSKKFETIPTGVVVTGIASVTGVATCTGGVTVGVGTTGTILQVTDGATQNSFAGVLVEKASIVATNVTNAVGTIDLAQGNVHYFTTNGSGASTADIIYKGGNNLSSFMKVGDNISVSLITKPNNSEYINAVTIDGAAVTEEWGGGTTPAAASGAAVKVLVTGVKTMPSSIDPGDIYFLSASTSGAITLTPPSTAGQAITRVGEGATATDFSIQIEPPVLLN